jgi:TRAP-type mannitol/chloroaromatic compound transport system substrate-binding protein
LFSGLKMRIPVMSAKILRQRWCASSSLASGTIKN